MAGRGARHFAVAKKTYGYKGNRMLIFCDGAGENCGRPSTARTERYLTLR